jgi:phage terminase large subunit
MMPLNNAQQTVAKSSTRFRVFVAGRRTGKTYLSVRELARFARHPNRKCLYIAPTYQMCRDIIWKDLKKRLGNLNWIAKTNESRLELELVNGSTIMLRSGDAGQSMRGMGVDFAVFDETSDIDPEVWYEVIRPALSAQKPPGSVLFCGTPKGYNWFKDLYDLGKHGTPDWTSFQYKTIESGLVPEVEIDAAKRDLDERTFRAEYEASFEEALGVIAYNFTDDHVVKWIPHSIKQVLIGCDFNVSPISACIMTYLDGNKGLHCIDEISMMNSNTEELVNEIKRRYPTERIVCFPDPAGAQRKTSASGKTDISILQNAGFEVRYRNRHPAVKDRINSLNSMLINTLKEKRLFIDPKCKKTIDSLRRHTYKENTMQPDKSTGFDHMFDSLTYAVEFLFPVTREVKPDNTRTFGVY